MQTLIGLFFLVVALGLLGIFLRVALGSRRKGPYDEVTIAISRARKVWGGLLGAVLVTLFAISVLWLPYPWARGAPAQQIVEVKAFQFGWEVIPNKLRVGTVAEFQVTTKDVNHGFGVYSPSGRLLWQTQAMPGYTNRLRVTLEESGSYTVRCLEFCGVAHHLMMTTFEVSGEQ